MYKVNIKKIIFVLYMIFLMNVTYSWFRTQYDFILLYIFAFFSFGIIILEIYSVNRINNILIDGFVGFILPFIVVTILSVITAVYVHHTQNISDVRQSIIRCIRFICSFLIAYYAVKKFGTETPKLIIIAGLISYGTVFIQYIYYGGISSIFRFFNTSVNGISLEVHNLTYCFGLFFLYYVLSDLYDEKYKLKMCIILAIGIFFGDKRALYLAMAISIGIYFFLHNPKRKQKRWLMVIVLAFIFLAFVYLYIIKTGILAAIFLKFNINDMSRLKFWNYFYDKYELQLGYVGRGISYTDNVMASTQAMHSMQITGKTLMHNDILRTYIGWGFIPFFYYWINFFLIRTRWFIRKNKPNIGWKYLAIASCYFIIGFFDNMITAENFNICFFVINMLFCMEMKKKSGGI